MRYKDPHYDWDSITEEEWELRGDKYIQKKLGCELIAIRIYRKDRENKKAYLKAFANHEICYRNKKRK